MLGIILAIFSPLCVAIAIIFIRKGLAESNYFSAILTVTIIGFIIFGVITLLIVPLNSFNNFKGILFFILAGIVAMALTRLFYYKGMEILGASWNASLFAAWPLFGSFAAVIILSEVWSLGILAGCVLTVCGVIILERSITNEKSNFGFVKSGFIFPIAAAILSGFGVVFMKLGLNTLDEPVIGATVGYTASLCLYLLLMAVSKNLRKIKIGKKEFRLFLNGGIFIAISWILTFYAFKIGDVVLISPILNIEALFIILLSYFFLNKEAITRRLVIGAAAIVIGVSIIVIS